MSCSVLIVEDNATLARNMATYLRQHGYDTQTAGDAPQAFRLMQSFSPSVVLVDYGLPGLSGLDVLRRLRDEQPAVKTVMITGHGNVEIAVEAMKSGACDYLSKPLALANVRLSIETAMRGERQAMPHPHALASRDGTDRLDALLGVSAQMLTFKAAVRRLLDAEYCLKEGDRPAVLITGETGTGKELVARALHDDGPAAAGPFVAVNCAAMPLGLIESELFGHERGAFTDARAAKPGLIELAGNGTLFLDEIGEMDLSIQSKLLRVIEEKAVRRVGSLREHPASARIMAATNQELETLISEGRFRSDLFFRLRIVHLNLPPLRQRGQDILLLARHFVRKHCARYGKEMLTLPADTEQALLAHAWPGNVRELRNRLEQAVLMAQGGEVALQDLDLPASSSLPALARTGSETPYLPEEGLVFEEFEKVLLQEALERTRWNVTRAAKLLGLSRDTLRYRMEKFGLKVMP